MACGIGLMLIMPNDWPSSAPGLPSLRLEPGIPTRVVDGKGISSKSEPLSLELLSFSESFSSSLLSSLSSSSPSSVATDAHSRYRGSINSCERGKRKGSKGKKLLSSPRLLDSIKVPEASEEEVPFCRAEARSLALMMEKQYTKWVACATRANCFTTLGEQI